jgi:hypothetical protein
MSRLSGTHKAVPQQPAPQQSARPVLVIWLGDVQNDAVAGQRGEQSSLLGGVQNISPVTKRRGGTCSEPR